MAEADVGYEIYAHDFKRWELCEVRPHAAGAINEANRIYKQRRLKGVKVVRVQEKRTGFVATRTVFQQSRDEERRHIVLSGDFDPTVLCREVDDLLAPAGLKAINRALRSYLDDQCITAIELLHGHIHAKRFAYHDNLRYRALSLIASVQTKGNDCDSHTRIKELDGLCDKALRRTRKAMESGCVPELEPGNVARAYAALDARTEPRYRDFLFTAGITMAVSGAHSWPHKLARTLEILDDDVTGGALELFDRFIADILAGAGAIQDLFGAEPDLCTVVCHLADLARGKLQRSYDMSGALVDFNRVMADRPLTACRAALYDRVAQSLEGVAPLTRGRSNDEVVALAEVTRRLCSEEEKAAVSLSPSLCAAVEERSSRHAQSEIDRLSDVHRKPRDRIPALLDLCGHLFGERAKAIALENIESTLQLAHSTDTLLDHQAAAIDEMRLLAEWQQRVTEFAVSQPVSRRLDKLLDDIAYEVMQSKQVLLAMEERRPSYVDRAEHLVSLCRAGAITQGRVFEKMRDYVLVLVQQPGFVGEYTGGSAGEQEREDRMRNLWRLLRDAGLA